MHDIVSHVDDGVSPEPAWSALVEHFIGTSQVELGHMRRELYALRMDDQTTLTKFIERITFYTKRLAAGGSAVRDEAKLTVFINGLHARYTQYTDLLCDDEALTYSKAVTRLRSYHKRKFGDPSELVGVDKPSGGGALMVTGKAHGRRGKHSGQRGGGQGGGSQRGGRGSADNKSGGSSGGGRTFTCFNCNGTGHLARNCDQRRKTTPTCGTCGKSGHLTSKCTKTRCHACDKTGHIARFCPNTNRSGRRKGEQANTVNDDDSVSSDDSDDNIGHAYAMTESAYEGVVKHDVSSAYHFLSKCETEEMEGEERQAMLTSANNFLSDGPVFLDSGATSHFTNKREDLTDYREVSSGKSIKTAGSDTLTVKGIGHSEPWGRTQLLEGLRNKLVSAGQLWRDLDWHTTLGADLQITDRDGIVMAQGQLMPNNMYQITEVMEAAFEEHSRQQANLTEHITPLMRAHYNHGHLAVGGLRELWKQGHLPELCADDFSRGMPKCAACIMGKMTRRSKKKLKGGLSQRTTTQKGELIHCDSSGKMAVPTAGGAHFFILFIDDYTRRAAAYLMKRKSEALAKLKQYIEEHLNPEGLRMGTLRTDGADEFLSADFKSYCKAMGIRREVTARHTPEQNPVAERTMRTFGEMSRTCLAHSGLGQEWWGYAIQYACYTRDRCPTASLNMSTPYEAWTGRRPNRDLIKPFGAHVYAYVPDVMRSKWDMKAIRGIYVGPEQGRKCYKVYVPEKKAMIYTRDVQFTDMTAGTGGVLDEYGSYDTPHVATDNDKSKKKDTKILEQQVAADDKTAKQKERELQQEAKQQEAERKRTARIMKKTEQRAVAEQKKATKATKQAESRVVAATRKDTMRKTAAGMTRGSSIKRSSNKQPTATSQSADTDATTGQRRIMTRAETRKLETAGGKNQADTAATAVDELVREGHAMLTEEILRGDALAATAEARSYITPDSFAEAMATPEAEQWVEAMETEYAALERNDVFDVVPRPARQPVMGSRWTYKVKANADGSVDKFKARFVGKGFMQRYGVNYTETFAPVSRLATVRTLLALSAAWGRRARLVDAVAAFTMAPLEKETELYVEAPAGFKDRIPAGHVWKLNKALYGTKQAARVWYKTLTDHLIISGFERAASDPCLYLLRGSGGDVVLAVAVYVDDIPYVARTDEAEQLVWQILSAKFDMKDMGELEWYLGIKVEHADNEDGTARLSLSQELYAETVLERFGMDRCRSVSTPMSVAPTKADMPAEGSEEQAEMVKIPYRNLIGCLMYLAVCTRPDIQLAVSKLTHALVNPGRAHWLAAKRVLQYLRGTSKMMITYDGAGGTTLEGYVDASWADAEHDRRSTTGWLFMVGGNLVSWGTYVQRVVARSTAEAEYMAASDAAQEVVWLRRLLAELDTPQEGATVVYEDNQGCIAMAGKEDVSKRTKHIDVRYHYVREQVEAEVMALTWVPSAEQIADILTKPLPRTQFQNLRARMGMRE